MLNGSPGVSVRESAPPSAMWFPDQCAPAIDHTGTTVKNYQINVCMCAYACQFSAQAELRADFEYQPASIGRMMWTDFKEYSIIL